MGKIYAIKKGYDWQNSKAVHDVKVSTWTDCQKYIKGVKGAQYKSFTSEKEADEYLNLTEGKENKNCPSFYVDGSYDAKTETASFGVVGVNPRGVIFYVNFNKVKGNPSLRQTIGELAGSLDAVTIASKFEEEINIHYDYEGVRSHALGLWKRNSNEATDYYKAIQTHLITGMKINFVKVDSHTGEIYNELADELAKNPIGIESTKAIYKLLQEESLLVERESVKGLLKYVGLPADKIQIVGG